MDETQFQSLADAVLNKIEETLIASDIEFDMLPGGVLEIDFGDGGKMIINRHLVAREIWVAAKAGGFHYRYELGQWIGTRDGEELGLALTRLISAQAGAFVEFVIK